MGQLSNNAVGIEAKLDGVTHADIVLLQRTLLAFGLSFVIGFEREVRGAPAGDRTFALVGTGAAAITSVTFRISPQAIAGIVTGIGFIGAGLLFRGEEGILRGITSAAAIFVVAALGIVCGTGHVVLALLVAMLVLLDLEVRHIPLLRRLDARRYAGMVATDEAMPGVSPRWPDTPASSADPGS